MPNRVEFTEPFQLIRRNLHFILVEPESPGNVGSVARALKTTGFEKLILVNPCPLDTEQAKKMAHRSYDIIEQAAIVPTFNEALHSMRLVVATTMRKRHFKFPFFSPREIARKLISTALKHPVAIVFGREHAGLSNRELLQCHLHSTITTATQNPALNLAQAVMIYAHVFFMEMNQAPAEYEYNPASQYELEKFYEHLLASLKMVHFVPRDSLDDFISRFRRLIGRSMAEQRDIRLLHKLLQIFETRIHDLEARPDEPEQRNIY